MLLTAFDVVCLAYDDLIGMRLPRTFTRQDLIESLGAERDPPGDDRTDHGAGFVARADGRP